VPPNQTEVMVERCVVTETRSVARWRAHGSTGCNIKRCLDAELTFYAISVRIGLTFTGCDLTAGHPHRKRLNSHRWRITNEG
jgi:hypothetical protein